MDNHLHNTLTIPTQPSSCLVFWTEINKTVSTSNNTPIIILKIRTDFDGIAKKMRLKSRFDSAKLA